jgi:uncharacterized protein
MELPITAFGLMAPTALNRGGGICLRRRKRHGQMSAAPQTVTAKPVRLAGKSMRRSVTLLRIFVGGDARHKSHPLYESIVLKARDMHLAGVTVLRGHLGYGHTSRLRAQKIFRLSQDLPVVIEIVDVPSKIEAFTPILDEIVTSGLVTIKQIEIVGSRRSLDPLARSK